MTYFSGLTMVSGQAISVPKLKEVKNEHLRAGSCIVSASGQRGSVMETAQGNNAARWGGMLWPTMGAFWEIMTC